MGLACRIIRKEDGGISVLDRYGETSALYRDLVSTLTVQQQNQATIPISSVVSAEERAVYDQAVFRGTLLIAPNGELSNLSKSQWLLTRTPSFIGSYGNWSAGETNLDLDANGEPIFNNNSVPDGVGLIEQETRDSLESLVSFSGVENQALLLWGFSNLPEFQQNFGTEEEPGIEQFLDFYYNFGKGEVRTAQDRSNLMAAASATDLTTAQLMASQRSNDPDPIIKHELSSSTEFNVSPIEKSSIVEKLQYASSQASILGTTEQHTESDIFELLDATYAMRVSGVEDIRKLATELPEALAESILSNASLQQELLDYYQYLEPVTHFTVVEGQLIPVQDTHVRTTLDNTIIQGANMGDVSTTLNTLTSIDETTWERSLPLVYRLLQSVEEQTIAANIDTIGLSNKAMTKPFVETQVYLQQVAVLVELVQEGVATQDEVTQFVDSHISYFDIQEPVVTSLESNQEAAPLAIIEGQVDESSLFSDNLLVRVRDNVYTSVDADNIFTELLQIGNPTIPAYLYEGVMLGSSLLENRLKDFFTRVDYGVYFTDRDTQAKYNMSRYMFSLEQQVPDLANESSKLSVINNDIDFDYLTTSFVPEFMNYILEEKLNNSQIYNRLLKNFYVSDIGLEVRGDISAMQQELSNWISEIPLAKDLFDYAAISDNQNLLNIMEFVPEAVMSPQSLVEIASLNPEAILPLTGVPTNPLLNGNMQLPSYAGEVVKVRGILHKIVDRVNNIYSPDLQAPEILTIANPLTSESGVEAQTQTMTTAQQTEMNQRIDECS